MMKMNRISLIDFAKKQAMDPLLEKEVQVRAYELYEQLGKRQGYALQDWLEAEPRLGYGRARRPLYPEQQASPLYFKPAPFNVLSIRRSVCILHFPHP
jgi:hypothetical protein